MTTHAILSPSSAERWMTCPGSVHLSEGIEDITSEYAAEGTQAHALAEALLTGDSTEYAKTYPNQPDDMEGYVMEYVTDVLERAEDAEIFEVEGSFPIDHLTCEKDAKGTTDALILKGTTLEVHDLKYGQGVKVEAENNKQLMLYALAAMYPLEVLTEINSVRLVIHQPRLAHRSEHEMSIEELQEFAEEVKQAAESCTVAKEMVEELPVVQWQKRFLKPSEPACRWCKAKAECPAYRDAVMQTVIGDFPDYTEAAPEKLDAATVSAKLTPKDLSWSYQALDFVEAWVAVVRAKVYELLSNGVEVPELKLVKGRRSAKAWTDEVEAEQALKAMRLKADEMYSKKLATPTQVLGVIKGRPKLIEKVKDLYSQGDGKPTIAHVSDPREPIVIEGFDDVTYDVAQNSQAAPAVEVFEDLI